MKEKILKVLWWDEPKRSSDTLFAQFMRIISPKHYRKSKHTRYALDTVRKTRVRLN